MNLNGKTMNPGDLRTAITLKKRSTTVDSGGFQVQTWSKIADVLAKWQNMHGSEVWAAGMAGAKKAATVLIRYRNDVDEACAVEKGSTLYEIVSLDDIEERHEYLELKVQKWSEG